MPVRYARGPAADGSIGFTKRRISQRKYFNMKIDEYPPYKDTVSKLPIGLYGPAPLIPLECACGRYIVDYFCMCATSCRSMPKYKWAIENPEAYKAEQAEQKQWAKRWAIWLEQRDAVEFSIWAKTRYHVYTFERLRDAESPIKCWSCEKYEYKSCMCKECDGCKDKYCTGCDVDNL